MLLSARLVLIDHVFGCERVARVQVVLLFFPLVNVPLWIDMISVEDLSMPFSLFLFF